MSLTVPSNKYHKTVSRIEGVVGTASVLVWNIWACISMHLRRGGR